MTATDQAMSFFRTMKGAPHSVLAVLAYHGRPMTNRELQLWTGYHADTITRATQDLLQMGWLAAHTPSGPWFVAPGRRVPCLHTRPAVQSQRAGASQSLGSAGEIPGTAAENPGLASENLGTTGEIPGFPSSTGGQEEEGMQEEQDLQPPASKPGNPRIPEAADALREAGIQDPALSRLARLPHITPEYVRAHVERARREGRGLGAAVFRMERHWRVTSNLPAENVSPESRRTKARENIRRFLEGKGSHANHSG
jgi:hypothetical protein